MRVVDNICSFRSPVISNEPKKSFIYSKWFPCMCSVTSFTSLQKSYVVSPTKKVCWKFPPTCHTPQGLVPTLPVDGWEPHFWETDGWEAGFWQKLSGKKDGEPGKNTFFFGVDSPPKKPKMAVTKNSMVGKGNIWIFPGEVMVWWFDCYHWALLGENFTPAGCGFARGACSDRCQCSSVSSLQEVVACGGCRDRTNVGRKTREGRGVVTIIGGWRMVMCQILKSWVLTVCVFFLGGGGWKISSDFFWFSVFGC